MAAQDFAPSASTLMDLIAGHRVTEVIYVAAKLGIADLLAEGPKTAAELARLTDTHERSLLRLMRGLVTLGICVEHADSKIELTEMGNYLTAGSEPSLKAWALMEGTWQRSGWANLLESIRTAKTGLRGIVFDLPHCAEGARKNLAVSGVADRCEFIAGSFFDSVPAGADAIIMKSIIHDWNDERCVRILQNCHRALKLGTRLMVVDSNRARQARAHGGPSGHHIDGSDYVTRTRRMRTDGERASRTARQGWLPNGAGRARRPLQCNRGGRRMILP